MRLDLPLRWAALAVAASLAACSSTPVSTPDTTAAAKPTTPQQSPRTTVDPATPVPPQSKVATVTLPPHKDANSSLSKERSVYFDFDGYNVAPQFSPLVERHGKYLLEHPSFSIRVEGHTDERGSAEYNLALGQRRAESVLRMLKLNGARDTQMEAISYGEEKPRAAGHDDAAWGENRRADIAYR